MSRVKALFYTKGRYGKRYRETVDTNNEYLYSMARYPTKLKKEDMPKDYIEFRSRVICYMTGYLKTSGVVDVGYIAMKNNHLFKDDYLYISYKEKLKIKENRWGSYDYINYDVCVCGNSIVPILLSIEKYSNINIDEVKGKIYDKITWLKENCEQEYNEFLGKKNIDIFEYYSKLYSEPNHIENVRKTSKKHPNFIRKH